MAASKDAWQPLQMFCFQELKVKAVLSFTLSYFMCPPISSEQLFFPLLFSSAFFFFLQFERALSLSPLGSGAFYDILLLLRCFPVPDLFFYSLFPVQYCDGMGRMHTT